MTKEEGKVHDQSQPADVADVASMDRFEYTSRVFDAYEKRFAEVRMNKAYRDASLPNVREDIHREAEEMLCYGRIPSPKINILATRDEVCNGFTVRFMQFVSWEHAYGEANLIFPKTQDKKLPAVVICNGHSPDGRLGEAYQRMGFSLAEQGFVVLMSDNLGQGSRKEFEHWDAVTPLHLGITFQGMIVAESNAWIEWLSEQPFVDATKIGACGNSGGGTLTLFLAATNQRLAAIASCGYPSDFLFIHEKEKKHCACNLLRGCAYRADMWEIYSLFAPKPLMLSNGKYDDIFPADIFRRMSRKVRTVYEKMGVGKNFESALTKTKHPWDREDFEVLTDFFCRHLGVPLKGMVEHAIMDTGCRFTYPEDAITTNQLAEAILGVAVEEDVCLADVYVPTFEGKRVDPSMISKRLFAWDPMRILAQMELALTK